MVNDRRYRVRVQQRSTRPLRREQLQLHSDWRVLVLGKTGSGKSVYARWMLRAWDEKRWPILIVDQERRYTRDTGGYAEQPQDASVDHPWRLARPHWDQEQARVVVYEPDIPGWTDEGLAKLLAWTLTKENTVVYFDDLSGLVDAQHLPLWLTRLWTVGRKANVPIIAAAQRPSNIPRVATNQVEVVVVFRLTDEDDLKRAVSLCGGDKRVAQPLPKFLHWVYNEGDDEARLMAPIPVSEPGATRRNGQPQREADSKQQTKAS